MASPIHENMVIIVNEDRLAEFEEVGRQIWPYVRYFALCGACTDAIDAVVRLGRLLGEPVDESERAVAAADNATETTVHELARWLETSPQVHAKTGKRIAGELAAMVRKSVTESAE